MLAQVRLGGVGAILALGLVLAYGAGQPDWRVLLPILARYAGGALLLSVAVRRSDRAAIGAGFAVALLDVPMVFFAQWLSLPVSPSPGGVAGFTLGIFVLLVLLGALSLDARQTLLVAPSSAVAEVLLQREAGIRGGAWAASVVVLGCAAAAAAHLIAPGARAGGRRRRASSASASGSGATSRRRSPSGCRPARGAAARPTRRS